MQSNFVNETSPSDIRPSFWHLKGKVDYADQWPLMSSPIPVLTIVLCYLTFVLKIGPYLMKNRPPYQLKNVLIVYNIIQVIASIGLASSGLNFLWKHGLIQKTCVAKASEDNLRYLVTIGYWYMLAKMSELLDTVFFVLRKKQNQVTFLHVYHHTIMLSMMWYAIKFELSEHGMFLGTVNSMVHVVMYGYYCLSALPGMSKYLWWKKYITIFQLAQFSAIFIHILITKAVSDCPPSNFGVTFVTGNAVFFYFLFSNFYKNSYKKPNNDKDKSEINIKSTMNGANHANGTNGVKELQSQCNYRKKSEKVN